MKNLLHIVALSLFVTACSGKPTQPIRYIDRPYTLPDDTASWSFWAGASLSENRSTSSDISYGANPFAFESSLRDDLTLEWSSFALRYQISKETNDLFGVRIGVPLGYGDVRGFVLYPHLSAFYRHRYSNKWALEMELGGQFSFAFDEESRDAWIFGLQVGPVLQIKKNLAFSPRVYINAQTNYLGELFADSDILPEDRPTFTFPLELWLNWRHSLEWESSYQYTFERLGQTGGFNSHSLLFAIKHYW